jgi:hypothetical protein
MPKASKAYESPLISHARMRALYRGLVELRALARQQKDKTLRHLEACFVATAIDLHDGDLACDSGGANEAIFLDHMRAIARRPASAAISRPELKRIFKRLAATEPDAFPGTAAERLLCAVGSAMALQASPEHANLVLAFVRAGELSKSEWLRALTLMSQPGLPLIVVALPGTGTGPEKSPKKTVDLEALAKKIAIPVIPVDAGDPVALYRVTQESAVRARAQGGAAVIDALPSGTDPVKLLARQLVRKEISTEVWVQAVEPHLTGLMATRDLLPTRP